MIEIKGLEELITEVTRRKFIIENVAESALLEAAERVQEYAKEYVPIDKTNLQDAIVIEPDRSGIGQSIAGYNVLVDLTHEGTRAPTVAQYAKVMESGEGWSGVAKAGEPRGAHYMERARERVERELESEIVRKAQGQVSVAAAGGNTTSFLRRFFRMFSW